MGGEKVFEFHVIGFFFFWKVSGDIGLCVCTAMGMDSVKKRVGRDNWMIDIDF